ncbi:MAG: Mfa1 family fimbria major subunit [Dysgonamonadaceae bacterium]|jgi:hypothetical protein|nr:Mfa1 family fimbria major subunit [Dysgonamonadaceae bacterium]
MKIILRTLRFVCVALAVGIASCNTGDEPNLNTGTKKIDDGKQTFITITLNFPKSETSQLRSTGDLNATDEEAKINAVDVFIYDSSGYFLSRTTLPVAGNIDSYTTTAIKTTTGTKKIFVAVNLPQDIAFALEDKPANELKQNAKTLVRSQLASENGIIMTGFLEDCTFEADKNAATNNPAISVKRMVAKITVTKASNMTQGGVQGILSNLSFAINNFNERSFLVQGVAPEYKDANWTSGSYDASQFSQAGSNDYVEVNEASVSDVKSLKALYAAENTSQDHTMGEITRVTVRAAFIPDNMLVYKNGTDNTNGYDIVTSSSAGITTPSTFWMVTLYRPNPEIAFFYDENIAENYARDNGLMTNDVVAFTDGLCYWDIFLNNGIWDVLRNNYYKSTITRIIAPGRPNVDVTDPTVPPAVKTDITVNIDVLPWESVEKDYILEL